MVWIAKPDIPDTVVLDNLMADLLADENNLKYIVAE